MKKLVVILAGSAIALSLTAATTRHNARDDIRSRQLRAEAVRLRAHFDSVDKELRGADVSRLSTSQQAMRVRLISWLRDYRDAGRFPENDRFANRMVPFFRDSQGTLCAMAYLIDRSGRGDIVDKVANTRNNAYIHQLADDPTLVAWLDASGLTVDEAARIQPTYGGPVFVSNNDRVDRPYAILSMGLGGISMGATALNIFAPSRASGAVGLLSGVATIVAGAEHLRDRNGNKRVAQADLTVGSVTAVAALYTLAYKVKPLHRLEAFDAGGRVGVGVHARF
jgi:hypothetical protein